MLTYSSPIARVSSRRHLESVFDETAHLRSWQHEGDEEGEVSEIRTQIGSDHIGSDLCIRGVNDENDPSMASTYTGSRSPSSTYLDTSSAYGHLSFRSPPSSLLDNSVEHDVLSPQGSRSATGTPVSLRSNLLHPSSAVRSGRRLRDMEGSSRRVPLRDLTNMFNTPERATGTDRSRISVGNVSGASARSPPSNHSSGYARRMRML
eukprot:TRINITY_DN23036_c0_g1_i1.p1 TRINITY_DN23036_c0_g1~~TRINITY_DN23036_c0_g1_i1.p1  ORF type:complete len:206 (-),score=11.01 TRINITY_DN23036_c0_g1_i1:172-789(-)